MQSFSDPVEKAEKREEKMIDLPSTGTPMQARAVRQKKVDEEKKAHSLYKRWGIRTNVYP